jgi:hypothetical protein
LSGAIAYHISGNSSAKSFSLTGTPCMGGGEDSPDSAWRIHKP